MPCVPIRFAQLQDGHCRASRPGSLGRDVFRRQVGFGRSLVPDDEHCHGNDEHCEQGGVPQQGPLPAHRGDGVGQDRCEHRDAGHRSGGKKEKCHSAPADEPVADDRRERNRAGQGQSERHQDTECKQEADRVTRVHGPDDRHDHDRRAEQQHERRAAPGHEMPRYRHPESVTEHADGDDAGKQAAAVAEVLGHRQEEGPDAHPHADGEQRHERRDRDDVPPEVPLPDTAGNQSTLSDSMSLFHLSGRGLKPCIVSARGLRRLRRAVGKASRPTQRPHCRTPPVRCHPSPPRVAPGHRH